jgi:hypothetical protein
MENGPDFDQIDASPDRLVRAIVIEGLAADVTRPRRSPPIGSGAAQARGFRKIAP